MARRRLLGRVCGKFVRKVGRQKVNSQRLVKDEGEKATALTIRDCISNLNRAKGEGGGGELLWYWNWRYHSSACTIALAAYLRPHVQDVPLGVTKTGVHNAHISKYLFGAKLLGIV